MVVLAGRGWGEREEEKEKRKRGREVGGGSKGRDRVEDGWRG